MKKRPITDVAWLVIVALLLGCDSAPVRYYYSGPVSWALKQEVRDKRASEVDLKKLTRFEWDELILFPPYESKNEVCRSLSLDRWQCMWTVTADSSDDGQMVMAFLLRKEVVHVELHYRFHGDFGREVEPQIISSKDSVFAVGVKGKSVGGDPWLVLIANPSTKNKK
jgi:hypothetical protein